MALVALNCPSCNGDIQLDDTRDTGFCMYCGNKVLVKVSEKLKIDNSHLIENYWSIAMAAYDAKNYKEAENYCNKILEIQPRDHRAWYLKGNTVAWETGVYGKGFYEIISYWTRALQYIDNTASLDKDLCRETELLTKAFLNYKTDCFIKSANDESYSGFLNEFDEIDKLYNFLMMNQIEIDIEKKDVYTARRLIETAINTINISEEDCKDWYNVLMNKAHNCRQLLFKALQIYDKNIDDHIQIYKYLIYIDQECINATDDKKAIKKLRKSIENYNSLISELTIKKQQREEDEKQARIKNYWEQNSDKKLELEKQLKCLQERYAEESNSLLIKLFNNKSLNAIKNEMKLIVKELTMDR